MNSEYQTPHPDPHIGRYTYCIHIVFICSIIFVYFTVCIVNEIKMDGHSEIRFHTKAGSVSDTERYRLSLLQF